jgi:predicted extracellular nuclease
MKASYSSLLVIGVIIFVLAFLAVREQGSLDRSKPSSSSVESQKTASRAAPETIRICSQNLQRFGEKKKKDIQKHQKQKSFLVTRFVRAKCSVIALQEIILDKLGRGDEPVAELVTALQARTGRSFSYHIGRSRDKYITNGFIVANDIGTVKKVRSFSNESLPKIKAYSPPRYFTRGPVMLEIEPSPAIVASHGLPPRIVIFTMHFKSKRNGWKDPAKTMFEISRMEMAAGLRDLAFEQSQALGTDSIILLLGDRNNHIGTASAEVLTGELDLRSFDRGAGCIVNSALEPECSGVNRARQALVPLFEYRKENDPKWQAGGSHKYRGEERFLDEIFTRPSDMNWLRRAGGQLAIGLEGQFFKGSDHKLVWAELQPAK